MKPTPSQIAQDWVRRHSGTGGTDKLILWSIAAWTDEKGAASIPAEIIASDAGRSRSTIWERLKALAASNQIRVEGKGGRVANRYRIVMPAGYDPGKDRWDQTTGKWIRNGKALPEDRQPSSAPDGSTVQNPDGLESPTVQLSGEQPSSSEPQPSSFQVQPSGPPDATSLRTSLRTSHPTSLETDEKKFFESFADAATAAIYEAERNKGTIIRVPDSWRKTVRKSFDPGGERHEPAVLFIKEGRERQGDPVKLGTYFVNDWPEPNWDKMGAPRLEYIDGSFYQPCYCGGRPDCDYCDGRGLVLDTAAEEMWDEPMSQPA